MEETDKTGQMTNKTSTGQITNKISTEQKMNNTTTGQRQVQKINLSNTSMTEHKKENTDLKS